MNKIVYLTAKVGPNGDTFAKPRVVYVPENDIISVLPKTKTTPQHTGVKSGIKIASVGGKTAKVYENAAQVETARDPSSTNLKAQDKKTDLAAAATPPAATGKYFNVIASGTGAVTADAATVGKVQVFLNNTAAAVNINPASGETIGDGAADAAYSLAAGKRVHLVCLEAGAWTVAVDNGQ